MFFLPPSPPIYTPFLNHLTKLNPEIGKFVNSVVVARESKETSTWGPVKEWGPGVTSSPLEGCGVKGEGRMLEGVEVGVLGEDG